jgi:hypothetical protein
MSNIITTNIDENFPVQGQDNPSAGFRNNFAGIKTALTTAKSEITNLENNAAKTNADNNFNRNLISNALINNTQTLFKNQGLAILLKELDVTDSLDQKITVTGTTVIKFISWPNNDSLARLHAINLYCKFQLDPLDTNLMNYRINFSTEVGGNIKGYSTDSPFTFNSGAGGWHLKPYINASVNTDVNAYEHVLKIWSYNNGSDVYIKYLGSFA